MRAVSLETILMRLSDVLFSFTETLIALACVAVLGPSLENAMIAVGIAGIPYYAQNRLCHGARRGRRSPTSRDRWPPGAGPVRLVLLHLLPNVMPTMVVVATLGLSSAILAAAGLSFLGLGSAAAGAGMGRDAVGRARLLQPGSLADALSRPRDRCSSCSAFNLLGDAIREAVDPHGSEPMSAPLLSVAS